MNLANMFAGLDVKIANAITQQANITAMNVAAITFNTMLLVTNLNATLNNGITRVF